MIPAVSVNQMAAKTGAVVRNFFMATGWGRKEEAGRILWNYPLIKAVNRFQTLN
jgi:hypothetical protein